MAAMQRGNSPADSMPIRIASLLIAATAFALSACVHQEWQEARSGSGQTQVKTSKKKPHDLPEEDDVEERRYDMLR